MIFNLIFVSAYIIMVLFILTMLIIGIVLAILIIRMGSTNKKKEEVMKEFSLIIGFRLTVEKRFEHLMRILSYLTPVTDYEIIVVEQDTESKIEAKGIDLLKEYGVRHVFVFNPGPYNRSWGFNVGAKMAFGEIFIFCDADIVISHADIRHCIKIMSNGVDALDPKGNLWEVDPDTNKDIWLCQEKRRMHLNFAGGILFITDLAYRLVGGWDEQFTGWGCEDNAMTMKLKNYNEITTDSCNQLNLIHLSHPIDKDRKNRIEFKNNLNILKIMEDNLKTNPELFYHDCLKCNEGIGNLYKYKEKN